MAKYQNKKRKKYNDRSKVSPQEKTTPVSDANTGNVTANILKARRQDATTGSINQELITYELKKIGILSGVIILIIIILAIVLPHISL